MGYEPTGVDVVIMQRFVDLQRSHIFRNGDVLAQTLLGKFIDRRHTGEATQVSLFNEGDAAIRLVRDLDEMHHGILCLSNYLEAFERIFIHGQAEAWSVLVQIDITVRGHWLAIEDIPEQFVADFDGYLGEELSHG